MREWRSEGEVRKGELVEWRGSEGRGSSGMVLKFGGEMRGVVVEKCMGSIGMVGN